MSTSAVAPRYVAVALLFSATLIWPTELDRIEGFGAYRFGMTLSEADALYADDLIAPLRNDSYANQYLSRDDKVFDEKAEVLVMFDKHALAINAITLRFNRYGAPAGSGECLRLLKFVEAKFTEEYGTRNMIIASEPGGRNWHFPQGGVVSITNLCIGGDAGAVAVSFRP